MSWLATIDTKSSAWPAPARWSYRALKWFLIANGVFLAVGLAYTEVIKEHRVGLGSGIVVAGLLALIKGAAVAISTPRDSAPS